MKLTTFTALVLVILWPFHSVQAFQEGGDERNPFIVGYDEGPLEGVAGEKIEYQISFQIPDDFYLYDEQLTLKVLTKDDLEVGQLVKPDPVEKEDPFSGRIVPVHFNEAYIEVPITLPKNLKDGPQTLRGEIYFQGCSHELCYKYTKVPLEVTFVSKNEVAAVSHMQKVSVKEHQQSQGLLERITNFIESFRFENLKEKGIAFGLLVAFLGGLLTDFTPCVLPLIPVTLAIIGVREDKKITANILSVVVMVLGMAVMYSLLGVFAAMLGKSLGFLFQSIAFLIFLDFFLILMALSLLGLFDFQLPPRLQALISQLSSEGYRGIFIVGLTMGFLAAPCVGPVVGPLLIYVAQSRDVLTGFWLLLAYGLGMGSLFILIGSLYGIFKLKIKAGGWTIWLKKGLGILILGVALYYSQSIYAQFQEEKKSSYIETNLEDGFRKLKTQSKPVIIDFFAKWCPPCLELDKQVWSQSEMIEKFKKDWIFIKIDCTKNTEACEEAVDKYGVIGWPTVVFLDKNGNEVKNERLTGRVVHVKEMQEIMKRVNP